MSKYLRQYPAALLFLFLIYSSIVGHSIATSIVVIALTAFAGYRAYLDKLETPDPSVTLKKELESLRARLEQRENDVKAMKDDFAKISLSSGRGFSGQQVRF
jgi:cell division protein FtsB